MARVVRFFSCTAIVVAGSMVPLAAASRAEATTTASTFVLRIAKYAAATASNDRPASIVSAADVTNAVTTLSTLGENLQLGFNLGGVLGYSRLVLFIDHSTYSQICVVFPKVVGGIPRIEQCPSRAIAEWQFWPLVLRVSERAIAKAAAQGRAVSGSGIVAAGQADHLRPVSEPSFAAGRGGRVKFALTANLGGGSNSTVDVCVQFPKTAYGIPVQVGC